MATTRRDTRTGVNSKPAASAKPAPATGGKKTAIAKTTPAKKASGGIGIGKWILGGLAAWFGVIAIGAVVAPVAGMVAIGKTVANPTARRAAGAVFPGAKPYLDRAAEVRREVIAEREAERGGEDRGDRREDRGDRPRKKHRRPESARIAPTAPPALPVGARRPSRLDVRGLGVFAPRDPRVHR